MIKITHNGLEFYQFRTLNAPGLVQAVFSRHGGVSQAPWASLNLGGTVGDEPENVKSNLKKLVQSIGYGLENLAQVKQIHSGDVILAEEPIDALDQGDAIITRSTGLLLLMRFADCVPILLYDPQKAAAGIAHAGWQGTLKKVALNAVRAMTQHFGSNPADILAGIGPSIGPDHYYVGSEVIEKVKTVFPDRQHDILIADEDGVKLDLWQANKISLEQAGVSKIEVAGICTACNAGDWYSHRGENGNTGRFGAVIALK